MFDGPRAAITRDFTNLHGGGPDCERLASNTPPNVKVLGPVDDKRLVSPTQRFRPVFPSRDDSELIPVEAIVGGRAVLAHAGGGALYTSVSGATGELFAEQTAGAITAAAAVGQGDDGA